MRATPAGDGDEDDDDDNDDDVDGASAPPPPARARLAMVKPLSASTSASASALVLSPLSKSASPLAAKMHRCSTCSRWCIGAAAWSGTVVLQLHIRSFVKLVLKSKQEQRERASHKQSA
jgi:hypothetical protein